MKRLQIWSLLVVFACALALPTASAAKTAAAATPWQAGDQVRETLFEAQTELAFGRQAAAAGEVQKASNLYERRLQHAIRTSSKSANRDARAALVAAGRAVQNNDVNGVAAARALVWAALLHGSSDAAQQAAAAGDATAAESWLLLRDFRTATRFTRPGTDATDAITGLAKHTVTAAQARLAVEKDLLDTYQARLRELLADADAGAEQGFGAKVAEASAQASGYWRIMRERYREDLGAVALARADAAIKAYSNAAGRGSATQLAAARTRVERSLDGFVAAPFTPHEEARRAQQLFRFLELVPFEYKQGVEDGRVTADFEIQEAVGFRDGAKQAFDDLKGKLGRRDAAGTAQIEMILGELRVILNNAQQRKSVASEATLNALVAKADKTLRTAAPPLWTQRTDESDFDLIALTLDRLDAAVAQGQWGLAEQARLETYAFIEFGPELKLRAFDPNLALEIEGFIWFGARGEQGLAELIAKKSSRKEFRATRLALNDTLADAQATLGEDQSATTAIVNSAILVFREGLEAVLILAAITASMIGVLARRRRSVMIGALFGLLASIVTWGVAQLVLESLSRYGEKLEAIIGLIAVAVLLYVMNWFFHRAYWTDHIRKFHERRKKLVGEEQDGARAGFWSAQMFGFGLLGLTSVYREGFETVLFLQSLQLATDTKTVVLGALCGLTLTLGVAVVMFKLQRKLPYKKMLIATGVMLALVLFVMVGTTVRSLQGIGWLPVTPLDFEPPYWLGTWLGVFPTWETIGAQITAMGLVFGSYFLAEEIRVKRPQRRAARTEALHPEAAVSDDRPDRVTGTAQCADKPRGNAPVLIPLPDAGSADSGRNGNKHKVPAAVD